MPNDIAKAEQLASALARNDRRTKWVLNIHGVYRVVDRPWFSGEFAMFNLIDWLTKKVGIKIEARYDAQGRRLE